MLRFFIDRPIFAAVISIIIMLAGLAALRALPVEQYPDVVPPQVVVQANYPGASAEALSALTNLGYGHGEAAAAVAKAQAETPDAATAALIRAALRLLAPGG